MAETEELRALLERRCSEVRFVENQGIALESFGRYVCILYAYIFQMIDK
jgi:hypothetical protein